MHRFFTRAHNQYVVKLSSRCIMLYLAFRFVVYCSDLFPEAHSQFLTNRISFAQMRKLFFVAFLLAVAATVSVALGADRVLTCEMATTAKECLFNLAVNKEMPCGGARGRSRMTSPPTAGSV
jgi:hypothetical protein